MRNGERPRRARGSCQQTQALHVLIPPQDCKVTQSPLAFLAQPSSAGLCYQPHSSLRLRTPNPDNEGPLTLAQGTQALGGMLLTGQDICSGVSRKPASSSWESFSPVPFWVLVQPVLAGGGHGVGGLQSAGSKAPAAGALGFGSFQWVSQAWGAFTDTSPFPKHQRPRGGRDLSGASR